MPRNARVREKRSREERVGDESVRASLAKRSERSRSRHFRPVRLQAAGRALSWRSVRLSEASKKKGGYSICVWASCVCGIGARFSRPKRRSATCRQSFGHITLNTKGVVLPDLTDLKIKREREKERDKDSAPRSGTFFLFLDDFATGLQNSNARLFAVSDCFVIG